MLSSPVNVSPGHVGGHCSPWRAVSISVSADVDRSCRLLWLSSSPVNVSPGHEEGHCSPWRAVSVLVSAAVDRAVGLCLSPSKSRFLQGAILEADMVAFGGIDV